MNARHLAISALFVFAACATMPPCPAETRRFVDLVPGDGKSVAFRDALVANDHHGSSIAPIEIVDGPELMFAAVSILQSEEPCVTAARIDKWIARSQFVRISGRGHYTADGRFFTLDCVCSVEPVTAAPALHQRMRPLYR